MRCVRVSIPCVFLLPRSNSVRSIVWLILASFAVGTSLSAQSEADFIFYHGTGKSSRVAVDNDNRIVLNNRTKFDLALPQGSEVCVVVANAHPVNYRYSLDAVVDTTKPELPDVSKITAFLAGLPGYSQPAAPAPAAPGMIKSSASAVRGKIAVPDKALNDLIDSLAVLRVELTSAQDAAAASDTPESFEQYSSGTGGFHEAVRTIRELSKEPFHFNDPKLSEHNAEQLKAARAWAGADTKRGIIVDALAASAALFISTRDKLRSDYSPTVDARPRYCKTIAKGRNTIKLAIAKSAGAGQRDTYAKDDKTPSFVEINVESKYQRKIASLDPLTLAAFSRSVPVFAIRNDTLRIDRTGDPTNVRPGVMLSLNPYALGAAENWVLGFGLGVGYSSKDVISDLILGTTLSYQNLVRVGVGLGKSSQPESVKGAVVNQHIPANFGALKDAIETGKLNSRSWYLLMTIPGLSLGK